MFRNSIVVLLALSLFTVPSWSLAGKGGRGKKVGESISESEKDWEVAFGRVRDRMIAENGGVDRFVEPLDIEGVIVAEKTAAGKILEDPWAVVVEWQKIRQERGETIDPHSDPVADFWKTGVGFEKNTEKPQAQEERVQEQKQQFDRAQENLEYAQGDREEVEEEVADLENAISEIQKELEQHSEHSQDLALQKAQNLQQLSQEKKAKEKEVQQKRQEEAQQKREVQIEEVELKKREAQSVLARIVSLPAKSLEHEQIKQVGIAASEQAVFEGQVLKQELSSESTELEASEYTSRMEAIEELTEIGLVAADILVGAIPVVGQVKSLVEAITGKSLITQEELSTLDRAWALADVVLAGAGPLFRFIKNQKKNQGRFWRAAKTLHQRIFNPKTKEAAQRVSEEFSHILRKARAISLWDADLLKRVRKIAGYRHSRMKELLENKELLRKLDEIPKTLGEMGSRYVQKLPDLPPSLRDSFETLGEGVNRRGDLLFQVQREVQDGPGSWFTTLRTVDPQHADDLVDVFKWGNDAVIGRVFIVKEEFSAYFGKVALNKNAAGRTLGQGYQILLPQGLDWKDVLEEVYTWDNRIK